MKEDVEARTDFLHGGVAVDDEARHVLQEDVGEGLRLLLDNGGASDEAGHVVQEGVEEGQEDEGDDGEEQEGRAEVEGHEGGANGEVWADVEDCAVVTEGSID